MINEWYYQKTLSFLTIYVIYISKQIPVYLTLKNVKTFSKNKNVPLHIGISPRLLETILRGRGREQSVPRELQKRSVKAT